LSDRYAEIFLFNGQFSNIRFVDHFNQLLDLLEVHVFQFKQVLIYGKVAKIVNRSRRKSSIF